ncbi:unnamed protein product [Symbiodinium pilosum]|uniref:Uncharacterized protein n=1 Tax=Symbiodinium pilosum TaxID=2952 RepID=A0A812WMQ6_SYMPI|nr:unnamed protein product [Symbiodinium pilosum]
MGWASPAQASSSSRAAANAASSESQRLRGLLQTVSAKASAVPTNTEAERLQSLLRATADDRASGEPARSEDSFELVEQNSCTSLSGSSESWKDLGEQNACNAAGTSSSSSGRELAEDNRPKARRSGRTRQRVARAKRRDEVRIRTPSPDFYHSAFKQLVGRDAEWVGVSQSR